MHGLRLVKPGKIIGGIAAVAMLFLVLLSCFYLAAEVNHECTGEDCAVCACIRECENTLGRISCSPGLLFLGFLPLFSFLLSAALPGTGLPCKTLVSQKVRLDH